MLRAFTAHILRIQKQKYIQTFHGVIIHFVVSQCWADKFVRSNKLPIEKKGDVLNGDSKILRQRLQPWSS